MRLRLFIPVLLLFPFVASAQTGAGPTSSVDYLGMLTAALNSFTSSTDSLFAGYATSEWRSFAIIMTVIYGIKWAAKPGAPILPEVLYFLSILFFSRFLLTHYSSPLPWGGVSVRQLFPETGRVFASYINLSATDQVYAALHTARDGTETGNFWDGTAITYWVMSFLTALAQALLFIVTAIGFVGTAVFGIFGRIMIPFLLIPRVSFLFWNWLIGMAKYSFYQVVGAALAFIWSTTLLNFITAKIHGDYSLGHWAELIPAMIILTGAEAFSVLMVGHLVNDLFSGGAAAGGGFAGAMYGTVSRTIGRAVSRSK